jgi:ABC-type Fe3+-hydroxamate transport system substrate-binding protein
MAIDGRINVDVLFHDTDGTTSLKVVSLEDSTSYTTGKVAIVTGTVGTAVATVFRTDFSTPYRDSSGSQVTFSPSEVQRVAVLSPQQLEVVVSGPDCVLFPNGGRVAISDTPGNVDFITANVPLNIGGTASYTLVIYGT